MFSSLSIRFPSLHIFQHLQERKKDNLVLLNQLAKIDDRLADTGSDIPIDYIRITLVAFRHNLFPCCNNGTPLFDYKDVITVLQYLSWHYFSRYGERPYNCLRINKLTEHSWDNKWRGIVEWCASLLTGHWHHSSRGITRVRYVHNNLLIEAWKLLSHFIEWVYGPERRAGYQPTGRRMRDVWTETGRQMQNAGDPARFDGEHEWRRTASILEEEDVSQLQLLFAERRARVCIKTKYTGFAHVTIPNYLQTTVEETSLIHNGTDSVQTIVIGGIMKSVSSTFPHLLYLSPWRFCRVFTGCFCLFCSSL